MDQDPDLDPEQQINLPVPAVLPALRDLFTSPEVQKYS
jgi:hypothetical protein